MAGIHCSRCSSLINTDTSSSSAPPWCPTCGADFRAAPNEAGVPAPATVAVAPSAGRKPVPVVAVAPPAPRRPVQAPPPRQPGPKAPLPAGVPAEVAALGNPEQVHAPDERQARRNRLLLRGMLGALGLIVL